jgi:hypothetical protein
LKEKKCKSAISCEFAIGEEERHILELFSIGFESIIDFNAEYIKKEKWLIDLISTAFFVPVEFYYRKITKQF